MSTLSSTSSSFLLVSCHLEEVISLASCWRCPAKAAQAFLTSSVLSCSGLAFHEDEEAEVAQTAGAATASISGGVDTRTRWMTAPVAGIVHDMALFYLYALDHLGTDGHRRVGRCCSLRAQES